MLVTDGRFSGATRGLMVGHVAPEAVRGGPLAVVREGEQVTIDADAGVLHRRRRPTTSSPPASPPTSRRRRGSPRGVLGRYSRLVGSASDGATPDVISM